MRGLQWVSWALLLAPSCTWIPAEAPGTPSGKPGAGDSVPTCTPSTWYGDADGDGYGGALSVSACEAPTGFVAVAGDCADEDAAVSPAAAEICDGVDQDCDAAIDDEASDAASWYPDADGDGFGVEEGVVAACAAPEGTTTASGDCDDTDAARHPGALEPDCTDPVDYDCDGATGADDRDGDGATACEDCDDTDASRAPGATEQCDGVDQDCDGVVDDAASDAATWYVDLDGDGFGDPSASALACEAPADSVADDTDCDDTDPATHPGGTETCDAGDEDCDGDEEDSVDALTWYADADADGYGDPGAPASGCVAPQGYVADATDCDDGNTAVHPGATEADCADPTDYDCDGTTTYADGDGDRFAACEDCDDGDARVSPAAPETCDGRDEDCDGAIDEDALDADTWYADGDGDGYGDATDPVIACDVPAAYTGDASDCDDADSSTNPGVSEICDDMDQDCDGVVDDAAECATDTDGDGSEDWREVLDGTSPDDPDSDGDGLEDGEEATYGSDPLSADTDRDGVADGVEVELGLEPLDADSDGDGVEDAEEVASDYTWYRDADGDGYGDPNGVLLRVAGPEGYVQDATDCDDGDAAVHPSATEGWYDGVDQDCSGTSDYDADADGFDAATYGSSDCDDADAGVSPDGAESCDGIDNDCDGTVDGETSLDATTWYEDADGDAWGSEIVSVQACDQPGGYVAWTGDCADSDDDRNPSHPDECDGYDNDCDGHADNGTGTDDCCFTTDCLTASRAGLETHPYVFYFARVTWGEADVACEALGGGVGYTLAMPGDAIENAWIASTADSYGALPAWIGVCPGGVCPGNYGSWYLINGYPASYFNWAAGEPDNEDYVYITSSVGEWADVLSGGSQYFVCEGPY